MTKEERIINEAKRYYSGNIKCYDAFLHGIEFAEECQKNIWHDVSEEIFRSRDVTERIKTFDDACNMLGENHALVTQYRLTAAATFKDDLTTRDLIAYLKLRIICAALNEGWEADYSDTKQAKWFPWFYFEDGKLVYANSNRTRTHSYACIGVRLAFKSKELAEYAGKQFTDIYKDFCYERNKL